MTPSIFTQRPVLAAVAAGLVVVSFLPAKREAWLAEPLRHAADLLLSPVRRVVYSVSLGVTGSHVENGESLEQLRAERDRLETLVHRYQADLDEARQQIGALSHLRQVLPENTQAVSPIDAVVTSASGGRGYPRLEINRGKSSGVGESMVVVSGQYLVGRISDVGPGTATVALVTYPADAIIAANIVSPQAAEGSGRKVGVNLSVSADGQTFVTSGDIHDGVMPGDVAYLVDNTWPLEARGFVIGRVESVEKDPERPLPMHKIVVRPHLMGLTRVTVMVPLAEGAAGLVDRTSKVSQRRMRWYIFAIFAYVLLGLEQGLSGVLGRPMFAGAGPSLLLVLGVYVGFSVPGAVVAWSWLILGVLYDISSPVAGTNGHDVVVIGPAALGFLAGAAVMLQLRGVVFRGSVVAIAVAVFIVGIMVELVKAFVWSARGWPFPPFPGERVVAMTWPAQCVHIFLVLVYSAIVALPVGWVLLRSTPWWGFGAGGHGQRR